MFLKFGLLRNIPLTQPSNLAFSEIPGEEACNKQAAFCTMHTVVCLLSALCLLILACYFALVGKANLPPGPSGLPLLGNIFNLTSHELWRKANLWGKRYGELDSCILLHLPDAGVQED